MVTTVSQEQESLTALAAGHGQRLVRLVLEGVLGRRLCVRDSGDTAHKTQLCAAMKQDGEAERQRGGQGGAGVTRELSAVSPHAPGHLELRVGLNCELGHSEHRGETCPRLG